MPPDLAARVAGHLVMVGRTLDTDPTLARAHARAARRLAGRLAVTREAAGLAAYHCGEYAEALAELRAARRMNGSPEHLPVMADCERGLGRPERALAVADDPAAGRLDAAGTAELAIVVSGARRDLGQPAAAVLALQGPHLDPPAVAPWTHRVWYAYADALLEAGRLEDARRWFEATAAIDDDELTDAAERLESLGGGGAAG